MTSDEINSFIKKNKNIGITALSKKLGMTRDAVDHRFRRMGLKIPPIYLTIPTKDQIVEDKNIMKEKEDKKNFDKKYKILLEENEYIKKELEASLQLKKSIKPYSIKHIKSKYDSEATAVVLASDWHVEETVDPQKVNFKNKYNLDIAKQRADEFFQSTLKLILKEQQNVKINTLVLALLGDFISGNIHDELLENCSLRPIDASIFAENLLVSGIEFLLQNSDLNIVIPCHVGNHARITHKIHFSTEQGNSLETIIYYHLSNYFKNNKRVTFLISDSYYQIVNIYDYKIRFHHGHAIKSGGGIGGIYPPTYKAISQWQKIEHADLDCFGHLHQTRDGGNFLCNGSMIGWNAFSVMIKGDFERPKQTFFLIDKNRGRTVVAPIVFKS